MSCFLYIASHGALVAQLDRATGYEPVGQEFESLRAHHANSGDQFYWSPFLLCVMALSGTCISASGILSRCAAKHERAACRRSFQAAGSVLQGRRRPGPVFPDSPGRWPSPPQRAYAHLKEENSPWKIKYWKSWSMPASPCVLVISPRNWGGFQGSQQGHCRTEEGRQGHVAQALLLRSGGIIPRNVAYEKGRARKGPPFVYRPSCRAGHKARR